MSQAEIFCAIVGAEYGTKIALTISENGSEVTKTRRIGTKNGGSGVYLDDNKTVSDPTGNCWIYDYEHPVIRVRVIEPKKKQG